MFRAKFFIFSKHLMLTVLLLALLVACSVQKDTPTSTPELQQLRIKNSGSTDFVALQVLFPGVKPDTGATKIDFGDIPAGQTSTYLEVPSGVYRYAAYSYRIGNREVDQAVTDWVGESPMAGQKFTYELMLNLEKVPGYQVQLIAVAVDEP